MFVQQKPLSLHLPMRSNLDDKIKHWSLVYLIIIPPAGVQSHAVTLMVGVVYKGRRFVHAHLARAAQTRLCQSILAFAAST